MTIGPYGEDAVDLATKFEQVIADFPGTNYSRLAENRLRTMRLEGNL